MTVVCIAGMHRSGTSLVTKALNLSGVYLGPEEDVFVTAPDNPEGYWENQKFLELNDQILSYYEGAWDFPPLFPAGWGGKAEMLPYHLNAVHLIEQFKDHKFWGWKDPRNSLTIDFWKSVLPKFKVIICVRNPIEVAQSLSRRGYTSYPFAFNLWFAYNDHLFSSILPENRIVTHFDSYFSDPGAELTRLLDFIGIPATREQFDAALNSINLPLRHNQFTLSDLLDQSPSNELVELYQQLCLQAGPVYDECSGGTPVIPNFSAESYRKYKTSHEKLLQYLTEKEQEIAGKEQEMQVLAGERNYYRDLYSNVIQSHSWQITKPLRWVGRILERMRGEKK